MATRRKYRPMLRARPNNSSLSLCVRSAAGLNAHAHSILSVVIPFAVARRAQLAQTTSLNSATLVLTPAPSHRSLSPFCLKLCVNIFPHTNALSARFSRHSIRLPLLTQRRRLFPVSGVDLKKVVENDQEHRGAPEKDGKAVESGVGDHFEYCRWGMSWRSTSGSGQFVCSRALLYSRFRLHQVLKTCDLPCACSGTIG